MSFSPIQQIRDCRSVQELSRLWKSNVKEWSKFPADQAKELIQAKNKHKEKLEPFEERSYRFEERAAIIAVDGEPDYPVEVSIDSPILGAVLDVFMWPNRATFDGVEYSNDELAGLISRGISAENLRVAHKIKKFFQGKVIDNGR